VTAQIPDILILRGETRALFSNPLDAYIRSMTRERRWRPGYNTACRRGYVAAWRVDDGKLWLLALNGDERFAEAIGRGGSMGRHMPAASYRGSAGEAPTAARLFPGDEPPIHAKW